MSRLCLYFGTELPDRTWAEGLEDTDVVLEPYHPLVKYGGFAEYFPRSIRWVYVNPTSVDPWLLERSERKPPLIGRDERWNLPRLDLDDPAGLEWAVDTALEAHGLDDGQCHGLFVDDFDRLIPNRVDIALEYLVRIAMRAKREPRWFLNRGFELWGRVEALDAVLLEDITPDITSYEPVHSIRWVRDVVLPNVEQVKSRRVRVHSVGYADQERIWADRTPDLALRADLARVVDSVTSGAGRNLADWRISQ